MSVYSSKQSKGARNEIKMCAYEHSSIISALLRLHPSLRVTCSTTQPVEMLAEAQNNIVCV